MQSELCMVEHLTLIFEIQIGENKDKQAKTTTKKYNPFFPIKPED